MCVCTDWRSVGFQPRFCRAYSLSLSHELFSRIESERERETQLKILANENGWNWYVYFVNNKCKINFVFGRRAMWIFASKCLHMRWCNLPLLRVTAPPHTTTPTKYSPAWVNDCVMFGFFFSLLWRLLSMIAYIECIFNTMYLSIFIVVITCFWLFSFYSQVLSSIMPKYSIGAIELLKPLFSLFFSLCFCNQLNCFFEINIRAISSQTLQWNKAYFYCVQNSAQRAATTAAVAATTATAILILFATFSYVQLKNVSNLKWAADRFMTETIAQHRVWNIEIAGQRGNYSK